MYAEVERYIERARSHFDDLSENRKRLLGDMAALVGAERQAGRSADLVFICTHNSRRSQMAQLWAAVAAAHFRVDGVRTYSGGTEVTAFNPRAVAAMRRAGFWLEGGDGENPRYAATYSDDAPSLGCFSKVYDDPANPSEGFAAIMTCSDADEACPVVAGAAARLPIRYEDPKIADDTDAEVEVYDARCLQIATEMLYAFSNVS